MRTLRLQGAIGIVFGVTCVLLLPTPGVAQGCTPIRFTTPIDLGGEGQAYQRANEWKLTLGYRRLTSNQFFVGTAQDPTKGPGGQPPVFSIHTFVGDVAYSPTDRLQVNMSLPFSTASITRAGWGPGNPDRHQQRATGIGDLSALAALWLLDPTSNQNGNLSVGLGFKVPTGSHTKSSWFYSATDSVAFPADQTVQPSDGGWGITFQAQAFQQVREGIYFYGFGTYTANPKDQTEVTISPTSPLHWSVPDVYQARLGAAAAVWPEQGLSLSLGGRLDGIPKSDLFGGGDSTTVKRTSRIIYADPGLSLSRGRSSFTLSVPIRLYVNRMKSGFEERTPGAVNGGGYAKYLIFASFSRTL
jgi:hypothetical protein